MNFICHVKVTFTTQTLLSQSIKIQNPIRSPFSNVDLAWKMALSMEAIIKEPLKLHILLIFMCWSFWNVSEGMHKPRLNGTSTKTCRHKWMLNKQ